MGLPLVIGAVDVAAPVIDSVAGAINPNKGKQGGGDNVIAMTGNDLVDGLDQVATAFGNVNSAVFDNVGNIISKVPLVGPVVGGLVSHVDDVTNAIAGGIVQEGLGFAENIGNAASTLGSAAFGTREHRAMRGQINDFLDENGPDRALGERVADEGIITGSFGWAGDKIMDLFQKGREETGVDSMTDPAFAPDPLAQAPYESAHRAMREYQADEVRDLRQDPAYMNLQAIRTEAAQMPSAESNMADTVDTSVADYIFGQ